MSTSVGTSSLTGLGLSGLASGLDTTGIITKLMAVESAPKTLLQTKLSSLQSHTTALQNLNTAVAQIATTAGTAASYDGINPYAATSSSSAATAKASTNASPGSLAFTVDRVAAAQVSVTGTMSSWDTTTTPSITIRTGSSTTTDKTITFTSSNLDSVVAQINGSGSGVTATKVSAGTSGGVQQYRLQLRSNSTGEAGAFAVSAGTTYSASSPLPTTTTTAAADAKVTLYKGTPAEQVVTSSTNTFSSLLTGVDVTVSAVATDPVTVTVTPDATAATTSAQALTAGIVSLFSAIATSSAVSKTDSGSTAGVFTGDALVRNTKSGLLVAVSTPLTHPTTGASTSPSAIGITLTKDGTISFDASKFQAAMTADPAATLTMYQAFASNVRGAANAASAPFSGTISTQITSEQSQQTALSTQIDTWTTRLAQIQLTYTNQFNALETALSSLSSQSSYLTSQISGLSTKYGSSS